MQRNSSNPPTLSDSSFNAFYNDSDFLVCINTLNTTHGNNFKTNFYNQISGGKGGWVSASSNSNYHNGPASSQKIDPYTTIRNELPDYPIFLIYKI